MELTSFGGLGVRLTALRPGETPRGLVVLMHGFGASGADLVPLGRQIPTPPGVRYAFPEAPVVIDPLFDARAWWPIDVAELERAMARGQHRDRTQDEPPELAAVSAQLEECLGEMRDELGMQGLPLILGGFSQGSMLACDIAARNKIPLRGLWVFSGTLLAEPRWQAGFAKRGEETPPMRVLQSHGRHDPLLSFAHAERLKAHFEAASLPLEWLPFNGQHELPQSLLSAAGKFLDEVFVGIGSDGGEG
ncbi:MAG: alpha/beta hydrolase [Polyangiaceae bacterium]